MQTIVPFGIITACHAGDYFLAKATCASIRHYMPEIPVCVIVDGDFSINELKKCYGVMELRVSDFSDSRLPPICKGTSRTKFAAIWESPFERFLCIDADAIVLGDWQSILKDASWQFLALANPQAKCPPGDAVDHFFFNREKLAGFDPEFEWQNTAYFCAGAYAAQKACLDVEDFLKAVAFETDWPGTFQFADQGIFNYMVMKAAASGKLEFQVANRQYLVPDHSLGESVRRFGLERHFVSQQGIEPEIVHFCGQKPLIQNRSAYSALFTEFRIRHYQNFHGTGYLARIHAWSKIIAEELRILKPRLARNLFPANC
jgi:hypothetical protein